jgi:hypothetical protein
MDVGGDGMADLTTHHFGPSTVKIAQDIKHNRRAKSRFVVSVRKSHRKQKSRTFVKVLGANRRQSQQLEFGLRRKRGFRGARHLRY